MGKLVVCPDCGKPTHPLASDILAAAKESPAARSPSAEPIDRKCENCGRAIGRLETVQLWQNHVVCNVCHARLVPPPSPEPAAEKKTKARVTKKALPEPEPAENAVVVLPRDVEERSLALSPAAANAPTIVIDRPKNIPVSVSRMANAEYPPPPQTPFMPPGGQRRLLTLLAIVFVAGAAMYGALTLLRDLMGILTMIAFGLMAIAAGTVAIKLLLGYSRRRFAAWRSARAARATDAATGIVASTESAQKQ